MDAASPFGECVFTPGDHRNLGVAEVDPGAIISIPDSIGSVSFGLTPITALDGTVYSPTLGVAVVLMKDGGHVTQHGIRAGHDALNYGVRGVVEGLAQTAIAQKAPPTSQQITNAVASAKLGEKVAQAVRNSQSLCENVWAASGADSEIGHAVATWSLDKFAEPSETKGISIVFNESPWSSWTITGSVTVTNPCPATASASALDSAFRRIALERATEHGDRRPEPDMQMVLELLRAFRDRRSVLSETTFTDWWAFVKRHAPELACRLSTSRDAQERARPLVEALVAHLQDDNRRISAEVIEACVHFLEIVQVTTTSRLRHDLSTAAVLVHRLEGRTLHEALNIVATRSATVLLRTDDSS